MFGNIKDSLNYHLIMEGFYYDAEIEHIAEIIKNDLYFAVLEGKNIKNLKSTHDTYYFNIDDEFIYTNYYFDFGPLNISCLYKYCCKLNTCLQYSQGFKRVVHFTSANPVKRVNAAFLMGSYAIMYLKMEPKDIYRILLNTGGQFKAFVDASQGLSQHTIHLLDCLQAIQNALTFNFFNFTDFIVEEYDLYDTLQNGDMNWLLPRKFLAFIGPIDNDLMNGHPPDFYIKYFLENDVKTVIRLNNKAYDASVFTHVGIEHHELFFPDGTVPTKQILLQFLEISENARAAIAVHCKAGLGRTGSLIGAYIIKHYHMTAQAAIAWMRICRPGSVIGQQQGWLEKIEGWLWRQGNMYRLQHFGEGDRIPHHKYGIYSSEWPKEREKLIRHVQRRRLEVQGNSAWSKREAEPLTRPENSPPLFECPVHAYTTVKKSVAKSHYTDQKPPLAVAKDERCKKVSKILNKIQIPPQPQNLATKSMVKNKELYMLQNVNPSCNVMCQEENEVKSKQQQFDNKHSERFDSESDNQNSSRSHDVKQKIPNKIQRSSLPQNPATKSMVKNKELYKLQNVNPSCNVMYQENEIKSKQQQFDNKHLERFDSETDNQNTRSRLHDVKQKRYINGGSSYYEVSESDSKSSNNFHEGRLVQTRLRKRNQSENRELPGENRQTVRMRKHFVENLEQTQGDKLNDIKARRFAGYVEGEGNQNKFKPCKPRRRLVTSATANMCNKPEVYCPKNRQLEFLQPLKKSHLERMYTPRN